jgi:NADH dehydrogenase
VLVGGGPTGVEMAGALAELTRYTIAPEYHHIDTRSARILLFQVGQRLLRTFPEQLARKAQAELQLLPVGADDTTLRGNGIPTTDQQPDVLTGERGL